MYVAPVTGDLLFDVYVESNLEALCTPCHSKITAEMGDRWHDR